MGGIAICWSSKRSYILSLNHIIRTVPDFVCKTHVWNEITSIFGNPGTIKITYNAKLQMEILEKIGIQVNGKIWDPRIGHWLIESDYCSVNCPAMNRIFCEWYPSILKAQEQHLNTNIAVYNQLATVPPGI